MWILSVPCPHTAKSRLNSGTQLSIHFMSSSDHWMRPTGCPTHQIFRIKFFTKFLSLQHVLHISLLLSTWNSQQQLLSAADLKSFIVVGLSNSFWSSPAQSFLASGLVEIYNQDFCSLRDMYMFWNGASSSTRKRSVFLCRRYVCCTAVSAWVYPRCHGVQVTMDSVHPLSRVDG
jgi:hypothetical protein